MKSRKMLSSDATTIGCHAAVVISAHAAALRLCKALLARFDAKRLRGDVWPGSRRSLTKV